MLISHQQKYTPQNLTNFQLTDLPREILEIIASFLEVRCVLNMGQTCKLLHDVVINNKRVWRNLYERDFAESVYEVSYDPNVNLNWKNKYMDALHCNCVIIMNNVHYCNNDVNKLKTKFLQLGYRIILLCDKNFCNSQTLEIEVLKHKISPSALLMIFFFGYGFDENIFIGYNYYITYNNLCKIFHRGRDNYSSVVLFTHNRSHSCLYKNEWFSVNSLQWFFVNSFFQLFISNSFLSDELFEQRKGSNDENVTYEILSRMKKLRDLYINETYYTKDLHINYAQNVQRLHIQLLRDPFPIYTFKLCGMTYVEPPRF